MIIEFEQAKIGDLITFENDKQKAQLKRVILETKPNVITYRIVNDGSGYAMVKHKIDKDEFISKRMKIISKEYNPEYFL